MTPLQARFTLFPYTTLFRSAGILLWGIGLLVARAAARFGPGIRRAHGDAAVEPERDRDHERQTRSADRKSTRLNSSHEWISYAVFCLKKKKQHKPTSGAL